MEFQSPSNDPETAKHWELISSAEAGDTEEFLSNARREEIKTTPLFSSAVRLAAKEGKLGVEREGNVSIHPQYGLLGMRVGTCGAEDELEVNRENSSSSSDEGRSQKNQTRDLIYSNTNAPHSTFICGSQGVGKSHTLSCILENSLLSSSQTGALAKPLFAVMFHYDKFTAHSTTQLCESAYLCSKIPVRVLVSPSNLSVMKEMYSNLPGLPDNAPKPKVEPLYFNERQLNITMMKTLMAVGGGDGPMPLYLEVVTKILRQMAQDSQGMRGMNYAHFKKRLEGESFLGGQNGPLKMRLDLLESFLEPRPVPGTKKTNSTDIWSFEKGSLTIIDLSCPFVDENDACALFNLCLSLFLENRSDGGRLVALDEAHKFLTTNSREAIGFTETILSLIRQQRHLATRVVIATQEPTLSPSILDLCNVTIVHRFTSPAWFKALESHLAGACLGVSKAEGGSKSGTQDFFRKIVKLRTGEAFVFCPTAILDAITIKAKNHSAHSDSDTLEDGTSEGSGTDGSPEIERGEDGESEGSEAESEEIQPMRVQELGARYIRLKIRNRVTADGGRSILSE